MEGVRNGYLLCKNGLYKSVRGWISRRSLPVQKFVENPSPGFTSILGFSAL